MAGIQRKGYLVTFVYPQQALMPGGISRGGVWTRVRGPNHLSGSHGRGAQSLGDGWTSSSPLGFLVVNGSLLTVGAVKGRRAGEKDKRVSDSREGGKPPTLKPLLIHGSQRIFFMHFSF